MAPSPAEDVALLREAIIEAAALARRYAKSGARSWEKRPGQPVTEADLAINDLLHERLIGARPHYGWLSEETEDNPERLSKEKVWVVDPIDGTRAFIRGKPYFTITGALVVEGAPRAGVVANPMTEELFVATMGSGATLNAQPIKVTNRTELSGARMIGTREYFAHPSWPEPWPNSLDCDNPNSLALRICLVAKGARDAMVRLFGCSEWDIAAAVLIAQEAGAIVTGLDDEAVVFNQASPAVSGLLASGPGLHAELLRRVRARAAASRNAG